MLTRLRGLAARREDFSFETTLSGRAYAALLKQWRAEGCRVRLDFLWITDLNITCRRVKQRVTKGGHHIPDEVQARRFQPGICHLAELYRPLIHWWRLYDNTGAQPHLIEKSASVRFMPDTTTTQVQEPMAMTFEEESLRAMRAMRKAFADVVLENKSFGLPVIQWRAGVGVVEVPAEQLEPLARRILEVNGEPLPEAEERALLAGLTV